MKSTSTGRLIYELGGISEREMQKLKDEAAHLGKATFEFAFFMDKQKDERERGITISTTVKEFFTPNYHFSVADQITVWVNIKVFASRFKYRRHIQIAGTSLNFHDKINIKIC